MHASVISRFCDKNHMDDFAERWRLVKSCARCHRLKVKCKFEDPSHELCVRCFRASVPCSVDHDPTAETARKRKRVADHIQADKLEGSPGVARASLNHNENSLYPEIAFDANIVAEIVSLGLVQEQELKDRLDFFHKQVHAFYPLISYPENFTDYQYLKRERPVVLLACVLATTINTNKWPGSSTGDIVHHYLQKYFSTALFVRGGGFTSHLVLAPLILSLWCIPPGMPGYFNSQIYTLTAYNMSMCTNVGHTIDSKAPDKDDMRLYLTVYCCCASLGLSLPRYKLVAWSDNHSNAVARLLSDKQNLNDRYVCYYAKMLCLGQEMLDYLAMTEMALSEGHNRNTILRHMRHKLYLTLMDSGFMMHPGHEKLLLHIAYYHITMIVYDRLVNGQGLKQVDPSPSNANWLVNLQHLDELVSVCGSMIDTFVKLIGVTLNFPTFVYYRVMNALLLLVRLRVLLKFHKQQLEVDVEVHFGKVKDVIEKHTHESVPCQRMVHLLEKIHKWIESAKNHQPAPTLLKMNDVSKDEEIEKFPLPDEPKKHDEWKDFNTDTWNFLSGFEMNFDSLFDLSVPGLDLA